MAAEYQIKVGELRPFNGRHPHPAWADAIKREVHVHVVQDGVSLGSPVFCEMLQLDYCVVFNSEHLNQEELNKYAKKNEEYIRAECRELYGDLGEPSSPAQFLFPSDGTDWDDQDTPRNSFMGADRTPQGSMEREGSMKREGSMEREGTTPENISKQSIESIQPSNSSVV